MNLRKILPELTISLLLAIFFGFSLYLRVALPHDAVFTDLGIKYTSNDAYYHMRLIDNLAYNFPHLMRFDPYLIYPNAGYLDRLHFFDWLLAGIIWVISLGSPTQHIIDLVGVSAAPVLAALTIIPVYFIGKELFNRWTGVLAAALMAIMPGEFVGRTILGFTDHHVAEVLFSTTAILFLILAVKTAGQKQLTFNHLIRRNWATLAKPLVYALLTGLFLGIYFITWGGGLLFVFIISAFLIIQFIIDHLRRSSTDYLCLLGVIIFLITILIVIPFSPGPYNLVALFIALVIPLVLSGVSRLLINKGMKPAYYPLTLAGLGLIVLAVFYGIAPATLKAMLGMFSIFAITGDMRTTLEMQPLFMPQGSFTFSTVLGNFPGLFALLGAAPGVTLRNLLVFVTSGFFFSVISLGIFIRLIIKQGSAGKSLLVVWSLIILAAALGQRRFAYYFAVNVALLTAYISWQVIWLAGLRRLAARPVEIAEKLKRKTGKGRPMADSHLTRYYINTALVVIVIFFFVFFPNFVAAKTVAKQARFAPSDAWQSSLLWLKDNTPEPFGDDSFYYKLYPTPPLGTRYYYPESIYGVTAWWDYGYWITRIAHRVPTANPGQSPGEIIDTAQFFLSQEETPAREIMQKLGSSYVIIDYTTATTKLWAIIDWAGKDLSEFIDLYQVPQGNKLVTVNVFYPEYYRTTCVRLYNFDGKAVTPKDSVVISYDEKTDRAGKPVKQITSIQPFPSYEAALEYVKNQKTANYRIVGTNPFSSPVPLEAMENYKLIHSSTQGVVDTSVGMIPEVKIFQYLK